MHGVVSQHGPQDPCLLVGMAPCVSETCSVLLGTHGHGDERHSLVTLGHRSGDTFLAQQCMQTL